MDWNGDEVGEVFVGGGEVPVDLCSSEVPTKGLACISQKSRTTSGASRPSCSPWWPISQPWWTTSESSGRFMKLRFIELISSK